MRRKLLGFAALLVASSLLGGCDKCGDYFLVNPFAAKPPAPQSCHGGPQPGQPGG